MAENGRPPVDGVRKVIEAEIIDPDYHDDGKSRDTSFTSQRTTYTSQGPVYTGVFTSSALSNGGCMAQLIPLGLLLYCLGEYGFFPALGFGVFCLIGSVMGTLSEARSLMQGRPFNPWAWRIGNWCVSFLLTALLSGGFND